MSDKTATDKQEVSGNPNAVVFPGDKYGITGVIRREGLRAAGRVNGDEAKLRTLVGTLDTLRAHTIARYKKQLQMVKVQSEAKKAREQDHANREAKFRKDKIAKAQMELDALKAQGAE